MKTDDLITDEDIRLLKHFDEPQLVGIACYHEFGNKTYWPAQVIMSRAKKIGLVIERPESKPIVNSPGVYACDVILTDAGRKLCGLPLSEAGKQTAKRVEKTLF